MAPKLRVYNLARELNLDNAEIIRELQHMGVPVTSHSNTVDDRQAALLRKKFAPSLPRLPNRLPEVVEAKPAKPAKAEPVVEHVEPAPHIEAKAEPKIEVKPEPPVAGAAQRRLLPNPRLRQSRHPATATGSDSGTTSGCATGRASSPELSNRRRRHHRSRDRRRAEFSSSNPRRT